MPIKDLKDEFVNAGNGELHLSNIAGGCLMRYVDGPNGKREWQELSFWGGHAGSNKLFVVNAGRKDFYAGEWIFVTTDPIPPMGDLMEAARQAARAVLAALAPTPST